MLRLRAANSAYIICPHIRTMWKWPDDRFFQQPRAHSAPRMRSAFGVAEEDTGQFACSRFHSQKEFPRKMVRATRVRMSSLRGRPMLARLIRPRQDGRSAGTSPRQLALRCCRPHIGPCDHDRRRRSVGKASYHLLEFPHGSGRPDRRRCRCNHVRVRDRLQRRWRRYSQTGVGGARSFHRVCRHQLLPAAVRIHRGRCILMMTKEGANVR